MSHFIKRECYRIVAESSDPHQAILEVMQFIVKSLPCKRAYIFEKRSDHYFSNTYDALAEGVVNEFKRFEDEPIETIDFLWNYITRRDDAIVLKNDDATKRLHPQSYAIMNYCAVDRVVFVGVFNDDKLCGCIGLDDPLSVDIDEVIRLLIDIAALIVTCIVRRDRLKHLEYISYHDSLTGAFNAQAYAGKVQTYTDLKSIGVVYCDVFGLKRINDTLGHRDGDIAICDCYNSFKKVFDANYIYRIGGDEFVVLLPDVDEDGFNRYIDRLLTVREVAAYHFSLGYIWQAESVDNIYDIVNKAEERMYKDKCFYRMKNRFLPNSKDVTDYFPGAVGSFLHFDQDSRFYTYLEDNYVDPIFFFKSITATDSAYYLYYGDLQTNKFYISDNMKRDFGYDDNIVNDFMSTWESHILNKDDLHLFRTDITDILQQRSPVHDLRYRVVDSEGNVVWIRCYGHIKWSANGEVPLCFAGSITRQDKNYLVDPVTNLRRAHAAIQHIESCQDNAWPICAVGFALNHFTQINELKGRFVANVMLQRLIASVDAAFNEKFDFFRLDGMRFIGIGRLLSDAELEDVAQNISEMIENVYSENQLNMRFPGSIAVISEVDADKEAQEVLSDLISLLAVAKKMPLSSYVKYSDKEIENQKRKALLTISLNNDIANDFENFRLVIQPVVSAKGHRIESGECLLRWRYEGKDVPPSDYISILEENMLIVPLGKWIFKRAVSICKQAVFYNREIKLAVNVSYYQILDEDFIPFIRRTLNENYLSGRHIIIELTEMHFIDKPEVLIEFIDQCAELDIQVALDDFGEGYASLAMLLRYATNIIKLDRSLVRQMSDSKDNINFISSIVYACHKFGKTVCAEGVESETELAIVESTGCDFIQGFFFHRPMEVSKFLQLLTGKKEGE